MTYKNSVPATTMPIDNNLTGMPRVLQENMKARYNKLAEHANTGNCTCHRSVDGEVHVLKGCEIGSMLAEEYFLSRDIMKNHGIDYSAGILKKYRKEEIL